MIATFRPSRLQGSIEAPPSKSMAHRYLIGAALSGSTCHLTGVGESEDICATMDCLRALGAAVTADAEGVAIDPTGFMRVEHPVLECRESGSTLRFFLPLALCLGRPVTLRGSARLWERPLDVYEDLCREHGFEFHKEVDSVTVCGRLESGAYRVRGDVSSQFVTGLLFALVYLGRDASVEILPPIVSRPYIDLTLSALNTFGADVVWAQERRIDIRSSCTRPYSGRVEGDYSQAAFLDAFNCIGSQVRMDHLDAASLQGDRVYRDYFAQICQGVPTLDLSDCPDLGPVLFALAALKHGAVFTGTDRLAFKESDRGAAMHAELQKLGGGLVFGDNGITVPKQTLRHPDEMLDGHNDHRIVMALSVILSAVGGSLTGAEAVRKSYPSFFEDIKRLGAEVTLT